MSNLIENHDLKRLFGGVAVAAASGLLLGAAMQPNLDVGEVEGPQMLLAGGGPRAAYTTADAGVGVYKDRIPDYVFGTDWTQPPAEAFPEQAAPAADASVTDAAATEEPPAEPVRHVAWREAPYEPTVYPSMTGDTAYQAELPPPPPPPDEADAG